MLSVQGGVFTYPNATVVATVGLSLGAGLWDVEAIVQFNVINSGDSNGIVGVSTSPSAFGGFGTYTQHNAPGGVHNSPQVRINGPVIVYALGFVQLVGSGVVQGTGLLNARPVS